MHDPTVNALVVTAETITDEQIRELLDGLLGDAHAHAFMAREMDACRVALGHRRRRHLTRQAARDACAVAWNARHGAKP